MGAPLALAKQRSGEHSHTRKAANTGESTLHVLPIRQHFKQPVASPLVAAAAAAAAAAAGTLLAVHRPELGKQNEALRVRISAD